jgi:hypothetical protein
MLIRLSFGQSKYYFANGTRVTDHWNIPNSFNVLQPLGHPNHTLACVDQGQAIPHHAAPCHPDRIEGPCPLMSEGSHHGEYQNRRLD